MMTTMKNLFKKTLLFAAAAFTFASCSNDATEDIVKPGFKVSINANTCDVTRSAFGDYNSTEKTYPTLWEGNENWFVAINDNYIESVEKITFSNDLTSANATFELATEPTADANGEYTLYALSPASAWSSYDLKNDYLRFYIARNTQTPTATSCDPASQVLFAKSEPMENANSFDVNFAHLSAYVKFSFSNVAEGGVVNSVTISAEDVNLAGRYAYTPSTGTLAEYDRLEKSITLVTDKTKDLWLAVAPVDVSSKVLTFSITTDKGILSREVTMPATAKFESGKVVTFTINMNGIEYPSAEEGETWQLVTNVADITDGEYFIAGKSLAGNVIYLPSTTTSSAPSQKIINVPGLDLSSADAFTTTLIPEDARFTFTVDGSAVTITNTDSKYLYATNTNNGLRVGNTKCTWDVSANTNNSKALVFKVSNLTRYISVYQSQDWRSYNTIKPDQHDGNGASGSTFLYKKVEAVDPNAPTLSLDKNSLEFEQAGGSQTITATTTNYTGAITAESDNAHFTTSVSGNVVTVTAPANEEATVKNATITITAGPKSKTVKVTQDKYVEPSQPGEEVTVTFNCTDFTYSGSGNTGIFTANDDNVKIVQSKGTSQTVVGSNYNNPLRFYVGHNLTFTSTKTITKIVFTYDTSYSNVVAITKSTGNGTFSGPTNGEGTYTSTGDDTVVFTTNKQVRFKKIAVTYK